MNFEITQIESLVGDEEVKTYYLGRNYALEVTENEVKFHRIERPAESTESFHDLEIKSFKILNKRNN